MAVVTAGKSAGGGTGACRVREEEEEEEEEVGGPETVDGYIVSVVAAYCVYDGGTLL